MTMRKRFMILTNCASRCNRVMIRSIGIIGPLYSEEIEMLDPLPNCSRDGYRLDFGKPLIIKYEQ